MNAPDYDHLRNLIMAIPTKIADENKRGSIDTEQATALLVELLEFLSSMTEQALAVSPESLQERVYEKLMR